MKHLTKVEPNGFKGCFSAEVLGEPEISDLIHEALSLAKNITGTLEFVHKGIVFVVGRNSTYDFIFRSYSDIVTGRTTIRYIFPFKTTGMINEVEVKTELQPTAQLDIEHEYASELCEVAV